MYFKSMSLPGFNRKNQACSHQFHPKVSGMMIVMTPAMQNSCRAARWLRWFFSTGGTISSAKLSIANNFRRVHFDVRIYGMGKTTFAKCSFDTRHTYIYNNMHRDAHLYVYEAYMYDAYVRYVGLYISKWIESNTWPTPILSSKSSKGFPSIVWDWLSDGWKMIYVLLKWSIFRWDSFFFFGRDIHEYKMIFMNPSKFPWCYWTENWL